MSLFPSSFLAIGDHLPFKSRHAALIVLAWLACACTTVEEAPRVVQDTPGSPAVRPASGQRGGAPAPARFDPKAFQGTTTPTTVTGAKSEGDPQRRSQIRLELATALYQQGSLGQALEEARQSVALDPSSAQAYGLIGLIHLDLDERVKAQEAFNTALKLTPDDSELRNNYGWFLCRTGRYAESIPEFMAALRNPLYPTPARPLHNAGVCSLASGDQAGAEVYFQRAFQIDPTNPVSMYHLGEINLKRGNVEQARFYAQRLLASYPASAETLWLALRVDRKSGDRDGFNSLSSQLRRQFPASREADLLSKGAFGD